MTPPIKAERLTVLILVQHTKVALSAELAEFLPKCVHMKNNVQRAVLGVHTVHQEPSECV